MDNNETRKEAMKISKNGYSDKKIAKSLGFKSTADFRKTMSSIERDRLDYIGYYDYKY